MRRMRVVFLALLACAIVPAAMGAQSSRTCMILGTVFDSSRTPIAGASVEVSASSGDQPLAMSTDADGKFQFTGLPSGTYTLTISYPEYQTFKREGIELSPGMNTSQTIYLRPNRIRD